MDKADRIAYIVKKRLDKIYGQIKWELSNKKTNTLEKQRNIKAHLYRVIHTAFEVMTDGFEDMALTSFAEAGHILSRSIPAGHLSLVTELKPITEAITQQQKDQIKDAVFEPMAAEKVDNIVKGQTAGLSWQARLAQQTSLAPPEHLSSIVTTGFVGGDTPATLANKILPFVQGVVSTAKRVARNESMRIAHESRMEAYEDLGDLVIGYQIHATMDSRVRPHHAARSGQIYYKKPKAGQLGTDKMPRPPIEEDGTVAHNCRCWITPVLEIQAQVEDDPAAKALFTDNKGDLIPNPSVYTTWFKNANEADQKKVVGAKRIAAVKARIGPSKSIDWSHFVDPKTGKLLDADYLANETNEVADKRVASFKRMILRRDKLTQDVYTYGYIPPTPGKLVNQIKEPEPQLNPVNAGDIPIAAQISKVDIVPTKQPQAESNPAQINNFSDMSNMVKIGSQQGSNEGGTYQNELGQKFYIKTPKSKSHAENEILASQLYKALGINSVEVHKGNMDGQLKTVSPIVDSTGTLADKIKDPAIIKQLQSGFAVDCWLANWDVAGLTNDNVIINDKGQPVRVDPGGCLLYRAMGKPKGMAFGNTVLELETFLDAKKAPQASKIFGSMSEEDKKASAAKLLLITDKQIEEMVKENISDPLDAAYLTIKLKARKEDILNKYGLGKDSNTDKKLKTDSVAELKPIEKALEKPVLKPTEMLPAVEKEDGEVGFIEFINLWKSVAKDYYLVNKSLYSVDDLLYSMKLESPKFEKEKLTNYIPTYSHTYYSYAKIMFSDGFGFNEDKPTTQKTLSFTKAEFKEIWKAVLTKNPTTKIEDISPQWMLAKMSYVDKNFGDVPHNTNMDGYQETYEDYAKQLYSIDYGFELLKPQEDKTLKPYDRIQFKTLWRTVLLLNPVAKKELVSYLWMLTKMGEQDPEFKKHSFTDTLQHTNQTFYDYAQELYNGNYGFNTPSQLSQVTASPSNGKYKEKDIKALFKKVTSNYLLSYKPNLTVAFLLVKMTQYDSELMNLNWNNPLDGSLYSTQEYVQKLYSESYGFDTTTPDTSAGGDDEDDNSAVISPAGTTIVDPNAPNQPSSIINRPPVYNKPKAEQEAFQRQMGSTVHLSNYVKKFEVTKEAAGKFIPMGTQYNRSDKSFFTRYLGSEHETINGRLRSFDPTVVAKVNDVTTVMGKEIKELSDNIKQHGSIIPKGTILYRGGVGFSEKPDFYTDHGFLSTSINYDTARSFYASKPDKHLRKLYTITVEEPIRCAVVPAIAEEARKPGSNAVSIPGVCYVEHEFLFPPKCRFLITGKVYSDNTWEMKLYAPLEQ